MKPRVTRAVLLVFAFALRCGRGIASGHGRRLGFEGRVASACALEPRVRFVGRQGGLLPNDFSGPQVGVASNMQHMQPYVECG